ncbi:hypothetical protein FM112_08975 [Gulosibacter sp. 10]|nr:hypothetical protein FM112_08975 [Gulosibacter sp. 10]
MRAPSGRGACGFGADSRAAPYPWPPGPSVPSAVDPPGACRSPAKVIRSERGCLRRRIACALTRIGHSSSARAPLPALLSRRASPCALLPARFFLRASSCALVLARLFSRACFCSLSCALLSRGLFPVASGVLLGASCRGGVSRRGCTTEAHASCPPAVLHVRDSLLLLRM